MCNVSSEEQYMAKLAERYAQDTIYMPALKAIIESENLRSKFEE